jgi:3-methyladenine DNA glycosylase AlkC
MAEALKNHFGPEIIRLWAGWLEESLPGFRRRDFLTRALAGFDDLELMGRGRHLGEVVAAHLPENFPRASRVLRRILETAPPPPEGNPISSFVFMPAGVVAATRGLHHFAESMALLKALTKRFTSEFAIRPFLRHHPEACFALLRDWTSDPDEHVRRLVSEGTRPRLPWAERVPALLRDPRPGLELLEVLKDDPAEYVRRSVANHLNDIGKDHPSHLISVARRWGRGADAPRLRLLRHALRSLVKAGHPEALGVLGFGEPARVVLTESSVRPARVRLGQKVEISATLTAREETRVLLDYRIHFRKANGGTSGKVFKGTTMELREGESKSWRTSFAAVQRSTRALYPGVHLVEICLNGQVQTLGRFELLDG